MTLGRPRGRRQDIAAGQAQAQIAVGAGDQAALVHPPADLDHVEAVVPLALAAAGLHPDSSNGMIRRLSARSPSTTG